MKTNLEARAHMVSNLYTFTQRLHLRQQNSIYSKFWYQQPNDYDNYKRVGNLMENIEKLPETATRAEWVEHYFSTVRSWAQINYQVELMVKQYNLDYRTALNLWWARIIDVVYEGWDYENKVFKIIEAEAHAKGYTARKSTTAEDRMGADTIILDKDGNIISAIQDKSLGYWTSRSAKLKYQREVSGPYKYAQFKEKYGVDIWYCVIQPTLKTGKPVYRKTFQPD